MIPRNAQPTSHRTPRPRIDFTPQRRPAEPRSMADVYLDALAEQSRAVKAERVWRLVRQTAEGTNCPTSSPSSPD